MCSPSMDWITGKRLLDEKCQAMEELKLRHERKEQELIKHIGMLYNDLQQSKKKLAYFILKYQKQKKSNDVSTQTDEIDSSCYQQPTPKKTSEQYSRYYSLRSNNPNLQYISATPHPQSDRSLSSPSLSTTDPSSRKHHESSSSAYNTAESLPSSTYSDEKDSLERVLNAASTMYTNQDNLQHTIQLQEELFRQHLRLRGIHLNSNDGDEVASEHYYDNIDSETSDFERRTIAYRNRSSLPWYQKKSQQQQRTVRFSLHNDIKPIISNKIKSNEQYYSMGRRRNLQAKKSSSRPTSNLLTVTIT